MYVAADRRGGNRKDMQARTRSRQVTEKEERRDGSNDDEQREEEDFTDHKAGHFAEERRSGTHE